jgi:2-keto-4-pentenoate hydratase/2-oxohepta-3-ene-1,7-dioic acid hydratase in catechol pathway
MRFVSFCSEGSTRLGIVQGDEVVDLASVAPDAPVDLVSVLRGGPGTKKALQSMADTAPASARRPLATLELALPIANPGKIVCLGLNYADHAAEGGHARPSYPSFFLRASSSLVAPGAPIVRPSCSEQLDFEAELVAVVGRRARHVGVDAALEHVAGYSCFNDASVRDYQRKTAQWTIGKNFDATGAFGPMFVTADELPPGARGLRISTRLNGERMQDANTADMLFPVAETLALLTECMTLEPGDFVVMGTPAGVGHARRPPVWMKDGDVVEVEIEGIGVLRNPVVDEARDPKRT